MINVQASSVIDAPSHKVWPIVRDFAAVAEWLPGVRSCVVEGDGLGDRLGAIRRLDMGEAGIIREQLRGLSDAAYRFDFAIIETSLPIIDYRSTIRLRPITNGDRTFISWSGNFDTPPEHAAEMTARMPRDIYQPGLDGIAALVAAAR